MALNIEGHLRPEGSKPKALRRSGQIPAVLYGHNGTESTPLVLNGKDAQLLVQNAVTNNTSISLNVPELSWQGQTILREVQTHPFKPDLYHLSFFAIASQESLEVSLPIHYTGEPVGVKEEGGVLDEVANELNVRVAPDKIPEYIDVDVSKMHIGDAWHVGELVLPEGAQPLDDPDLVVVSVLGSTAGSQTVTEEEEEATEEVETESESEELI
jgi:large subunit ribosomal protein L25